jgi:2-C-methyl-D-erythritol 4-phosphate cytidylyltransferase
MNTKQNVGIILLAGGLGTRMQSSVPKQFLLLKGKPIARHSFDLLTSMPEISEIVVVCAPEFRHLFNLGSAVRNTKAMQDFESESLSIGGDHSQKVKAPLIESDYGSKDCVDLSLPNAEFRFNSHHPHLRLAFALPGEQRQDSVYNGLQEISENISLVGIHDSARPCITTAMVQSVLLAASEYGAATVGMPVKFTLKESDSQQFVKQTLDRSRVWEIQTPQVIQTHLLKNGFQEIQKNKTLVTDDVSIIELLGLPVKLVEGSYKNLKITTQEDLAIAESFLKGF